MSLGRVWHEQKTQTLRVAGISISNPDQSNSSKILGNDSMTVSCSVSLVGAAPVYVSVIKLSPLTHTAVVTDS